MQTLIRRCFLMLLLGLGMFSGLAHAQAPGTRSDYQIGPGDALRITVYQSPDLTLDTRVSEAGIISYPLLGTVKLGGLSISQAEKTISDGLVRGNFLKNPQVSIIVTQVRGNQASVLGLVNKPGRFPLETSGMRLTDLLALAGGVAPGGSDIVTLTGTRNGKPLRTEIDLPSLFAAGGGAKDPIIQDGDVIYVDRMPTIYIYGEVQRPGAVRLERGMTLMQALAAGGGVTARGTERGIKINRAGPDGKTKEISPSLNDTLENGDVIYVRQSLF